MVRLSNTYHELLIESDPVFNRILDEIKEFLHEHINTNNSMTGSTCNISMKSVNNGDVSKVIRNISIVQSDEVEVPIPKDKDL